MPEQVRERLIARREELRHRLSRVSADIRREAEPLSADFADQATQRENDEVVDSIGAAAVRELREIDAALRRLDENRYGICEICNAPIEQRRLDSVPYATRCTRCVEEEAAA